MNMLMAILLALLSPFLVILAIELIFRLWDWVKIINAVIREDISYYKSQHSVQPRKPLMRSISNRRYGYGKWGL